MACLNHIRYHGVLLWNEITGDWLSVAMWFGTYRCLGTTIQTRRLVQSLLLAKTTWFGIPDFVTWKESGWDMVLKTMKYVTAMTYRWDLGWQKRLCRLLSHLYQRECASWEVWVGWDRAA